MNIRIKDICRFGKKSDIKAGEGNTKGKYMFFTSSIDKDKRIDKFDYDEEGIIMGTGGNATLHYYSGKFAVSTDCLVLLPNSSYKCKYLYYFFLHNMRVLEGGFRGAGLKHTSKSYIENIELTKTHSLLEQDKIISVLSNIDNTIVLQNKRLKLLNELTRSLFIEMFGDPSTNPKKWVKTPLHKLCHISSSRRIYQNEQTLQGIPFLRISDLSNLINNGNTKVELYISEERYEELKSKNQVPKSGDILITSRGTLGECYIIKEDDKFYFQDGMISWMFDFVNYILPTYLKYLFDMREFKREITSRQIGTTVSYLSIEIIKKLQIMLPNIKLQYKFSELINKIDKSKLAVKKSLEELEILKKSLMQKYFA